MKPLQITAADGTGLMLSEVPLAAHSFEIDVHGELIYYKYNGLDDDFDIKIPKGNYTLCGTFNTKTKKFSFDVLENWVEKDDSGFIDYELFRGHLQNYYETSEESFASLILSELKKIGITIMSENILIIETI